MGLIKNTAEHYVFLGNISHRIILDPEDEYNRV
jgi:hypothetical protein